MSIKCPNCGKILPDQSVFCDQCGTPIPKIAAEETPSVQGAFITCPGCGRQLAAGTAFCDACGTRISRPAVEEAEDEKLFEKDGVYRWVYELPMLKSFFLLFEVWKVLAMSAVIVMVFGMLVGLINGSGFAAVLGIIQVVMLVLGILFVLSFPAYYIVTKANNGKYTVLFEMTEEGINHTQIKTEKAKALDLLVSFAGSKAGSWSAMGAGMMSSGGASLYSDFARVKKIKAYPHKNVIMVNGRFVRNQVYVEDADFDFVLNYIIEHCPDAKIG